MNADTNQAPDTTNGSTGQLTDSNAQPKPRLPKEMAYVGVSATELEEIGAETYHGTGDTYQRADIQDLKDAIITNENMTAAGPATFEPGTDQRGETNDVQQRSEDGDSGYGDSDADNQGLDDAGDGDPATPDTTDGAYENQENKPKAPQQHGSDSPGEDDEAGTTPNSNNSQQSKLG